MALEDNSNSFYLQISIGYIYVYICIYIYRSGEQLGGFLILFVYLFVLFCFEVLCCLWVEKFWKKRSICNCIICHSCAFIHYVCKTFRPQDLVKSQYMMLKRLYHSDIWQAPKYWRCREAWVISKWSNNSKAPWARGFGILLILMTKRPAI